jgi:leader peptidase (prepilin peptidase)/N-methyltransferase
MLLRGHGRDKPIPFGPYLAIAGWLAMMWGQTLLTWYLHAAA